MPMPMPGMPLTPYVTAAVYLVVLLVMLGCVASVVAVVRRVAHRYREVHRSDRIESSGRGGAPPQGGRRSGDGTEVA